MCQGISYEGKYCLLYVLHVFNAWKTFNVGFFLSRNIFGPVLGSSPAQNPPVLPSMQPGFGGGNCDYYYSDANTFSLVV